MHGKVKWIIKVLQHYIFGLETHPVLECNQLFSQINTSEHKFGFHPNTYQYRLHLKVQGLDLKFISMNFEAITCLWMQGYMTWPWSLVQLRTELWLNPYFSVLLNTWLVFSELNVSKQFLVPAGAGQHWQTCFETVSYEHMYGIHASQISNPGE